MPRLLIIADDLSGAADAAGATGAMATVSLDGRIDAAANVVAIDLDSRRLAPDAARSLAAGIRQEGGPVFHKMDSLLRGNWPHELAGLRRGAPVFVAPAWPERGRVTIGGRVVASTAGMADDRGRPLADSIVARLAESGLDGRVVGAGAALPPLPGDAILVFDAQTRDDLDRIARLAIDAGALCVGAGGLASSYARALGLPTVPQRAQRATGPVLTVVGTTTDVSQRQALALERAGGEVFGFDAGDLPDPVALGQRINAGHDVALVARVGGGASDRGVVSNLAATLMPLLPRVGGLVLTGGETARAILIAGGVSSIRLSGELEPGVPVGRTVGRIDIPLITKSGAFGNDDVLLRAIANLRGQS